MCSKVRNCEKLCEVSLKLNFESFKISTYAFMPPSIHHLCLYYLY
jgi:hypothetical protein